MGAGLAAQLHIRCGGRRKGRGGPVHRSQLPWCRASRITGTRRADEAGGGPLLLLFLLAVARPGPAAVRSHELPRGRRRLRLPEPRRRAAGDPPVAASRDQGRSGRPGKAGPPASIGPTSPGDIASGTVEAAVLMHAEAGGLVAHHRRWRATRGRGSTALPRPALPRTPGGAAGPSRRGRPRLHARARGLAGQPEGPRPLRALLASPLLTVAAPQEPPVFRASVPLAAGQLTG